LEEELDTNNQQAVISLHMCVVNTEVTYSVSPDRPPTPRAERVEDLHRRLPRIRLAHVPYELGLAKEVGQTQARDLELQGGGLEAVGAWRVGRDGVCNHVAVPTLERQAGDVLGLDRNIPRVGDVLLSRLQLNRVYLPAAYQRKQSPPSHFGVTPVYHALHQSAEFLQCSRFRLNGPGSC